MKQPEGLEGLGLYLQLLAVQNIQMIECAYPQCLSDLSDKRCYFLLF